jgi:hypothetical protein
MEFIATINGFEKIEQKVMLIYDKQPRKITFNIKKCFGIFGM